MKNIHLAELAILSLPEDFIMKQNPEDLKNNYLNQYEVNGKTPWVIKKKNIDDIPF